MSSIIKNRLLRDAVRAVLPIELRRKLADRYFEYQEQRELHKYREELRNPELETTLEDGFLRIYMTYRCNARCRFCDHYTLKRPEVDPKLLYEYLPPLLGRLKIVGLVGGEVTISPETMKFCGFLSENYPQVTVQMESNGIAFNEEFRELAAEHLFRMHFSVNAPDEASFGRHVWEGKGGSAAYGRAAANIRQYVELLSRRGRTVFGPSVSMVVSHDHTVREVLDFLKLSLEYQAQQCGFYLNHLETGSGNKLSTEISYSSDTLRTLMEVERVLRGRYFITFRLMQPPSFDSLQHEVDAEPIEALNRKYADVLAAAKGRDIHAEYLERCRIRTSCGKKLLTLEEDFCPTLHLEKVAGQDICFAPWKELDISTDGRIAQCGWMPIPNFLNVCDFVRDGRVDWNEVLNHPRHKLIRLRMLKGDYRYCMPCCQMNPAHHPVTSVLEHQKLDKAGEC